LFERLFASGQLPVAPPQCELPVAQRGLLLLEVARSLSQLPVERASARRIRALALGELLASCRDGFLRAPRLDGLRVDELLPLLERCFLPCQSSRLGQDIVERALSRKQLAPLVVQRTLQLVERRALACLLCSGLFALGRGALELPR